MKKIGRLILALSLVIGTSTAALADKPLPKPDVLSEEEIFTSSKLSAYDTIILKDLTLEGVEYSNANDEEKAKIDAMVPLLVRTVTESLEMELKSRKLFKAISRKPATTGKAVIFEGRFTEFNAGNRAARFWVGFGAGKTYLKMKGKLVDAETGKDLAVFEDRETGYKGSMSMENFADLFPHQAKSIGENLANFIQKLY